MNNPIIGEAEIELFAVYAAYGRATIAAHSLERALSSLLIATLVDRKLPREKFEADVARFERMTLGPLIERFNQWFSPAEELQEELDNMLYFRNKLIHDISGTVLHRAREVDWEQRVIQELTDITTYFLETREMLRDYSEKWLTSHGLSYAKLLKIGIEMYPGAAKRIPVE
jgi:hypothetical protein